MPIYSDQFKGIFPTKAYHVETALSLAIACDLAYRNKEVIESTTPQWGFPNVAFIEVNKGHDINTQCIVMGNDDHLIVVFRGSSDLKDWFANFQAVRDPGPLEQSKAHEGFQDALYPAVIKLTETIDKFKTGNQRLWVTGHSLGGALGSLYAGMLIENDYPVYGIYTFASPRPGDGAFASALNNRVIGPHYRVINSGDIVPHLPPEPFFSHPGDRIILKDDLHEISSDSWFDQRIEALKIFIEKTGDMLDVADNHKLSADDESYIPRLLKDLERSVPS